MERKFDIKNANELLATLNKIVEGTKNTKSISDSSHQKVANIVSEIKTTWRSYLESAVLENILVSNPIEGYLTEEGKKYYKELSNIANKKEKNLSAFKSAIKPKSIGLFSKTSPQTTCTIKTKSNNEKTQDFYLYEAETRNEYFSLNGTLSNPRVPNQTDLIGDLDEKFIKKEFVRETEEETQNRMNSYFESLKRMGDEGLNFIPKDDPTFQVDLNTLDNLKKEYSKKINATLRFDRVQTLFNKYGAYLTPSTKSIINKLSEEMQKSKELLDIDNENMIKEHSTIKSKMNEKAHGSVKSNRVVALLTMLSHKKDSMGKDLTEEQIEELVQELKNLKETTPEEYAKGQTEYENLSKTADTLRRQEIIADSKNQLDDSVLTIHEQEDRDRYYNFYVVRQGIEKFVPKEIFAMLYDKYLKMEEDNTMLIGQMVHYYLGYLDYVDKIKEKNIPDEYKSWENYVDTMLVADGFVRTDKPSR